MKYPRITMTIFKAVLGFLKRNAMIVCTWVCLFTFPAFAASRLADLYNQLEAAPTPAGRKMILNDQDPSPAAAFWDFGAMNPAEEIPVLAANLKSSKPDIVSVAISQLAGGAMFWSSNATAMIEMRKLTPLMWCHFNDPAGENIIHGVWKETVMRFLACTRAPLTPEMQSGIIGSMDDPFLLMNAAATLALMKPLPASVTKVLIAKMNTSFYDRAVIMKAFGNAKVSDPEVIRVIIAGLSYESPPSSDRASLETNSVRQAAAESLASIGALAREALPRLRELAHDTAAARDTRDQAEAAINRIESPIEAEEK